MIDFTAETGNFTQMTGSVGEGEPFWSFPKFSLVFLTVFRMAFGRKEDLFDLLFVSYWLVSNKVPNDLLERGFSHRLSIRMSQI